MLGLYCVLPNFLSRRDIEEEILSRSSEYYRAKSDLFLASNSGRQFFNKTIQVLNEESDFCKKYIHPSSEPEVMKFHVYLALYEGS